MADRAPGSTPMGASKVWEASKEDRRSHNKKLGALSERNIFFSEQVKGDQAVQTAMDFMFAPQPTGRMCRHCGKPVMAGPRDLQPKHFCSIECRRRQRRERDNRSRREAYAAKRLTVLTCKRCGGAFDNATRVAGRSASYCSETCRQATRRARIRPKRKAAPMVPVVLALTCAACGVGFETVRSGRGRPVKFCSAECRRIAPRRAPTPAGDQSPSQL